MNIAAARICRFVFATALLIQPVISFSQTSQATLQGQIINRSNGQPVAGAVVIERDLERNSQSYSLYQRSREFIIFRHCYLEPIRFAPMRWVFVPKSGRR